MAPPVKQSNIKDRECSYVYTWGNNSKRAMMKSRKCRIIQRFTMNSALIEFGNGQREVVSRNALRRVVNIPIRM